MPQRLQKPGARAVRSQVGRGAAAHTGEHDGRKQPFAALQCDRPAAAAGRRDRGGRAAGHHADIFLCAGGAQNVQHRGGGHRPRIDAPLLAGGHQAQGGEKTGHLRGRRARIDAPDKGLGLAVEVSVHLRVGEVAAPVAGGQNLFPDAVEPLHEHDARAGSGQHGAGGQPACAAAEDDAVRLHGQASFPRASSCSRRERIRLKW